MNRNGLSLLEIVIVITLMGILTALIVPNFINSSEKAKLKADITSAQTIQSVIDLYNTEQGVTISGTVDEIITELNAKKYLKQNVYKPQTNGGVFEISGDMIKINISGNANKEEMYNEIEEQLQQYIIK